MQTDRAIKTVRTGALILMLPVAAEVVYYSYKSFSRAWRFSFGEPQRWNEHWRVDPDTVVETLPRVIYFSVWATVIMASVLAFLIGLYLLNRVRQGQLFDLRSAQTIRLLGATLAAAMIADQMFHAVDAYLITWQNAAGPEPIRWAYDPSDLKTLIMAVILFLFGWVMQKGIEVAQENEAFV